MVPVFRERANVRPLYDTLRSTLQRDLPDWSWELIFVDDNSDDGTADTVRALAREESRVRVVQRVGRRGLSSAVVEGAYCAIHDVIVVMDGDLQHPAEAIARLVGPIAAGEADVTSASRFLDGADAGGLSGEGRRRASVAGNGLVRTLFGLDVTDPLTGFFSLRRDRLAMIAPGLSTMGFKILLDILVSARPRLRHTEIPFRFGARQHGESKLDSRVLYDFALFVLEKKVPLVRLMSPRFVSFALVGSSGVIVHMAIMALVLWGLRADPPGEAPIAALPFSIAQLAGALGAMVSNFALNNALTYRDRRLTGWGFARGLALFGALSGLGLAANVGVATAVNNAVSLNWSVSALAGILVGIVWNYATTRRFVWRD